MAFEKPPLRNYGIPFLWLFGLFLYHFGNSLAFNHNITDMRRKVTPNMGIATSNLTAY